jgi:hypothetical protein
MNQTPVTLKAPGSKLQNHQNRLLQEDFPTDLNSFRIMNNSVKNKADVTERIRRDDEIE